MTDTRTDEEYQKYMNELALRIGDVIDGEHLSDVATACIGITARAVEVLCPDMEQRGRMLMTLTRFLFDRAGFHCDVDINISSERLH